MPASQPPSLAKSTTPLPLPANGLRAAAPVWPFQHAPCVRPPAIRLNTAPTLLSAAATAAPHVNLPAVLSQWLHAADNAALATTAWSLTAALLRRAQTALALLVFTPGRTFVLLTSARLSLPRPNHPRGSSRDSAQAAAHALLRQLFPPSTSTAASAPMLLTDATPFLARDVPAPSPTAVGCRVVTCPVALACLPTPPYGTFWRPVRDTGCVDEPLIAVAHAASLSFGSAPDCPTPSCPWPLPPTPGPAPMPTHHDAVTGMASACTRLRQAIVASNHPLAISWLDCVGAQDSAAMADTPPDLAARGTFVSSPHYVSAPLSPRVTPPSTDPYLYPTNPLPPPATVLPSTVQDLFTPAAWLRVLQWFRSHWPYLRDCATVGQAARRGHVPTVVFTQDDIQPPYRGTIWDCRSGTPRPHDFHSPLRSKWHRPILAALLVDYPDHELCSFVTEGTASSSEAVGLVMVLGPHLQSLAPAFSAVEAALADAVRAQICDNVDLSVAMFAFVPGYSIPQGTAAKKDGSDRRTSDYGHPRKPTTPRVTAINVAIRTAGYPKERKPTNGELAHDVAVLRLAADLWGEDLFLLSEDFKGWFNQFAVHPSEWFKQTFLWLRRSTTGQPIPSWLVEYVMGFGMSSSSGIAQRFSDALLWLLLRRFDASEGALLDAETDPVRRAYLDARARLGPAQALLWAARCFTDDSAFAVVGAARTVRFIITWGGLLAEVGVVTKLIKRQAGCCIYWNGAYTNAFLANQTIPSDKALRACRILTDVATGTPVVFSVYRKVMGLVTHIRGILRWRRMTTYGMFRPFAHGLRHPAAPIVTNPDLLTNAAAFVRVLLTLAGCSCADPPPSFAAAAPYVLADIPRALFGYSDAALQGAPVPGLGGWLHGYFFSFALPAWLLGYPIVQLEFLGIILAHMIFAPFTHGARSSLISDSETSTKIIDNDGAHTDETQWLHAELSTTHATFGGFSHVRHGHGESNPYADLASRGRLRELLALARQMGIPTTRLPIPDAFLALLERFKTRFGARLAEPGALRSHPRTERPRSLALPPPHLPHDTRLEEERGDEFLCNYSGDGPPPPVHDWTPTQPPSFAHLHPIPNWPAVQSPHDTALETARGDVFSADISGDGPFPTPPVWLPTPTAAPEDPPTPLASFLVPLPPVTLPTPATLTYAPAPFPHQQLPHPLTTPTILIAHTNDPRPTPALQPPPCPLPCIPVHVPTPRQLNLTAQPPLPSTTPAFPHHLSHAHMPTPLPPGPPPAPLTTPGSSVAPHPRQPNAPHGSARKQQRRARHLAGPGVDDDATSPFAFDATAGPLAHLFSSLDSTIGAGIPEGTLAKDDLAWNRWETYCALVGYAGTPPWRTDLAANLGFDLAGSNRESKLLCGYLLWCYEIIQPRSKRDDAPQPQSAFNMAGGVRRIHKRYGIEMVSCRQLAATLKGITLRHIQEHGPESLLPDRKEPMPPPLARQLLSTPEGSNLGSRTLRWSSPLFMSLGAMFALSMSTGFRKAEVALPNGTALDDRRLHRAAVVWRIDGALIADPSPSQLQNLVAGRDIAIVRPPRCKNDYDGTTFGPNPIYLPFDPTDTLNAASWLQRLELAFPCHGSTRRLRPLFFTDTAATIPVSHSTVDTYLRHLLHLYLSVEEASKYSFHSFRIGFATALLAAGCSHDTIQALARWRSEESILIYGRMDATLYCDYVDKALQQNTMSITGRRLPFAIDEGEMLAVAEAYYAKEHDKAAAS